MGGLGIRDLKVFNAAALGKWWSRIARKRKGVWRQALEAKYGVGRVSWVHWINREASRGFQRWKNICRLDGMYGVMEGWLQKEFKLVLGNGELVSFWRDNRTGVGNVCQMYQSFL